MKRFCPTCGRQYPQQRDSSNETTARCPRCDHAVNTYDNYCRYCGLSLYEQKAKTKRTQLGVHCGICGTTTTYAVDSVRKMLWLRGMSSREAFPELSHEAVVFIDSGCCPECTRRILEGASWT